MSAAQGSAGNVISALASFFVPGLGQLLQGRFIAALWFFVFTMVFYISFVLSFLGVLFHFWAIINAALYESPAFRKYA